MHVLMGPIRIGMETIMIESAEIVSTTRKHLSKPLALSRSQGFRS
jgi:hypothetical protein